MKVKDFVTIIEERIPCRIQESFDNSGIQIGPFDREMIRPLLSLDVSEQVVKKAIEIGSNMIISHHPFFFQGFKSINTDYIKSDLIIQLIKHEITVYSLHTPIDKIQGGLNDHFCSILGLKNVRGIIPSGEKAIYKLQVFVPQSHKDIVLETLASNGAGFIGNYSECTFSTSGIGTFKAHEGTNPFIGSIDKREYAKETKIETVIPVEKLDAVIKEVERVHPYEEVAMDVIPLNKPEFNYYLCRTGEMESDISLEELNKRLKEITGQKSIRYCGNEQDRIKKIAICTGSGGSLLEAIKKQNVDAFITGDIGYHDFQNAQENRFALIDISHFNTEKYFGEVFQRFFEDLEIDFSTFFSSYIKEF